MIDLRSLILTNPETLQLPMNKTGLKPGDRWHQVPGLHWGYLPGIVRFLKRDEATRELRIFGSGTIIGCLDGRWLVIATASHVLDNLGPNQRSAIRGRKPKRNDYADASPRALYLLSE